MCIRDRSSVLIVADNCDDVTHLGVTTETYGDLTKNNNVDLVYDTIIMGGNPMYYSYGTWKKQIFMVIIQMIAI